MKVKMILPALVEARRPGWRSIKYSLFPPLGLATLAAYLTQEDEVTIQDEHVEKLDLEDEPDLVAIEVYVTSARRAYEVADRYRRRWAHVALGGLWEVAIRARRVAALNPVLEAVLAGISFAPPSPIPAVRPAPTR